MQSIDVDKSAKKVQNKYLFVVMSEKKLILQLINKGYFSEAFLFKRQVERSPPSGLNRELRKNPLFSL